MEFRGYGPVQRRNRGRGLCRAPFSPVSGVGPGESASLVCPTRLGIVAFLATRPLLVATGKLLLCGAQMLGCIREVVKQSRLRPRCEAHGLRSRVAEEVVAMSIHMSARTAVCAFGGNHRHVACMCRPLGACASHMYAWHAGQHREKPHLMRPPAFATGRTHDQIATIR